MTGAGGGERKRNRPSELRKLKPPALAGGSGAASNRWLEEGRTTVIRNDAGETAAMDGGNCSCKWRNRSEFCQSNGIHGCGEMMQKNKQTMILSDR